MAKQVTIEIEILKPLQNRRRSIEKKAVAAIEESLCKINFGAILIWSSYASSFGARAKSSPGYGILQLSKLLLVASSLLILQFLIHEGKKQILNMRKKSRCLQLMLGSKWLGSNESKIAPPSKPNRKIASLSKPNLQIVSSTSPFAFPGGGRAVADDSYASGLN
ncbi:hypothetical protein CCACVL1_28911 [Corchorus capsularis]|uniref:Uncharacterized protein n=1 Tax=Corchorus capsularis TaxID=210143 RepID=A0A1R3G4U9_COCAP|nr:hypothetical protein CCACVL1_28911 [Corchorus capsularis]